jgi:hypothetical protein
MKKISLIFIGLLVINLSFGQKKDKSGSKDKAASKDKKAVKDKILSKEKIGPLDCCYVKSIKSRKDTSLSVSIGFNKDEFATVTSISSVEFNITSDTTNVSRFVSHLKNAIHDIGKDTIEYTADDEYYLQISNLKSNIYLFDTKSNGEQNIHINKDDAQKLVEWIEKCITKK